MGLKRDSKILDKLGLKFEEVCASNFVFMVFPIVYHKYHQY